MLNSIRFQLFKADIQGTDHFDIKILCKFLELFGTLVKILELFGTKYVALERGTERERNEFHSKISWNGTERVPKLAFWNGTERVPFEMERFAPLLFSIRYVQLYRVT